MRRPAPSPVRPAHRFVAAHYGTPLYAKLNAAAIRGRIRVADTRRTGPYTKVVLFDTAPPRGPRSKRNDGTRGTITIGRDFFRSALREYRDWQKAFWREAIQNSVDAGATHIELGIAEQPDGTFRVWCQDDGRGMDRETMVTKFLALGGSTKRDAATGQTGGFGVAKQLLILPWIAWSITSQGLRARGAGVDWVGESVPFTTGTRLEVVMAADEKVSQWNAQEVLASSTLPHVKFKFVHLRADGTAAMAPVKLAAKLDAGDLVRTMPGMFDVYWNQNGEKGYYAAIRSNGLWMFNTYIGDGVEGRVTVEITGRSIDILSANRDQIRNNEVSIALSKFMTELAADTSSALAAKGVYDRVYKSGGMMRARMPRREVEAQITESAKGGGMLRDATPYAAPGAGPTALRLADRSIVEVIELLSAGGAVPVSQPADTTVVGVPGAGGAYNSRDGGLSLGTAAGVSAGIMLGTTPVLGTEHAENLAKQLAWEPDFLVSAQIRGWNPPKSLLPGTMSPGALLVAKVWTELCRYALMRLNCSDAWGVGFTFNENARAEFSAYGDANWVLINPFRDIRTRKTLLSPRKPEDAKRMWASAVHEVTHFANGLTTHNEVFASALTQNFATVADAWPFVEAIVEAVVRGAVLRPDELVVDLDEIRHQTLRTKRGAKGRGDVRIEREFVEVPVYTDREIERIVEVPVERIVYQDREVPVEVEKIVYVDRPVAASQLATAPVRVPGARAGTLRAQPAVQLGLFGSKANRHRPVRGRGRRR